ncbi:hypothetical protein OPQ81_000969 [Rhizoctonia solani]|nr:hypothetical protein OPQ81_000969 [Rhizoctonia solani]
MAEFPTLNSAALDSEEEDDDYVPGEQDSDSSESSAGPQTKKPRTEETLDTSTPNLLKDDTTRNALWTSFLESTKSEATNSKTPPPKSEVKTLTIEKKYRFAGEDVIEKVMVTEDSSEARDWRRRQSTGGQSTGSTATPIVTTPSSGSPTPNPSSLRLETNDRPVEALPPTRAKPPTKPRKSLSSLAAAGKPKKLTTLEKSRLDWQSHLASSTQEERDELERNRKAGGAGYLEKVDFLARVNERRENMFEHSKRKRR